MILGPIRFLSFHKLRRDRRSGRTIVDCREPERVLGNNMRLASRAATYLVALSILALTSQSRAQVYQGKELVKAELLADANAIVPGKPFTIGLLLRMAPRWHTYWAFSGDAGLPTELKWKLPSGWKVGEIQWPIPLKTIDPGDIETYGYENEVLLMQEITPPQKLESSRVKLSAEANWLVCEKICIPGSATPQLELLVSTTNQPANSERFARYRRLLPQNWPESNVASANWSRVGHDLRLGITSENLANYPALDFFPLPEQDVVVGHPRIESRNKNEVTFRVPIESSEKNLSSIPGLIVFSQQANGEDRAAWQISAAPTLSAASAAPARGIFTFLLFGFLGGIILNLMPCVLPVISLPQVLTRELLSTTERKNDLGSFLQGVFATVLATPCTAPFLGTALGFAFSQSAAVILAMFVAIAAGMSGPYLLLSAQPAWLRFLPKPGAWMLHVKQFMGFLLLATLLFLLYVLGAQRGLDGAIWASCFLLVVAIACWMKGAFIVPTASATKRTVSVVILLALVIASGAYFIGDKFQSSKIDIAASSASGDWQPFTPERLQTERDQGHAVFVDFTAAWWLTCKFNEKTVLENGAVREAFQRHGVVKLKADWTNGDPVITKLLQQFGRPGVPLYVLYPGKSEEPIVFPELLTKSILLDKLETISTAVASQ